MRILLLPFSWLYGLGAAARNAAYDLGVLRHRAAAVPVIAVGNLTAGGTGKTPLVEYLTRLLAGRGMHVAVVSRGYGRRSRGVLIVSRKGEILADALAGGDEPVQIARKFPTVSVVVGERRLDAAAAAVKECGADVIVLDDAFQHRSIGRDLDIVVLDAGKELLREPVLPAGMRREWFSGLRRAGLIGFSRASESGDPAWAAELSRWSGAGAFAYRTVIAGFASIPAGEPVERRSLAGKRITAFSGIGDPGSFTKSLRGEGIEVAAEKHFRDHHIYDGSDLEEILEAGAGTDIFMTTEKDMVRLLAVPALVARIRASAPFMYAAAGIEILRGESRLGEAVTTALGGGKSK